MQLIMNREHYFILAGETSADLLGASLMRSMQKISPSSIKWIGIGGEQMQKQGLISNLPISELSVIGTLDALISYQRLLRVAKLQIAQILKVRPKVVFTVDTKQFSLKFAMLLRKEMDKANWHVPIIQLVAPTIWAWGRWRAKKFEQNFDAILCLFPFEPAYFESTKTKAIYVGHPEAGRVPELKKIRTNVGNKIPPVVGLFPGSRDKEIDYNLLDMLEAARIFNINFPQYRFLLPTTSGLEKEVRKQIESYDLDIEVVVGINAFKNALSQISAALCVSGTATLQLALNAVPAVTCYKTSFLNFWIMRFLVKVKDPILPNILLGRTLYPCHLQSKQTPIALSSSLQRICEKMPDYQKTMIAEAERLGKLLLADGKDFETVLAKSLKQFIN